MVSYVTPDEDLINYWKCFLLIAKTEMTFNLTSMCTPKATVSLQLLKAVDRDQMYDSLARQCIICQNIAHWSDSQPNLLFVVKIPKQDDNETTRQTVTFRKTVLHTIWAIELLAILLLILCALFYLQSQTREWKFIFEKLSEAISVPSYYAQWYVFVEKYFPNSLSLQERDSMAQK